MKKIVVALLIITAVAGMLIELAINLRIKQGIPISDCNLDIAHCAQTMLWIIFSAISGMFLIFDPQPMLNLLIKFAPWKAKRFYVQLLGFFLLASLPLTVYSLTHDCNASCLLSLVE